MSDFFPGAGWWLASDGRWYAPDTHPDPAYRKAYAHSADLETSLAEEKSLDQEQPADAFEEAVVVPHEPDTALPAVEIVPPLEIVESPAEAGKLDSLVESAAKLRESTGTNAPTTSVSNWVAVPAVEPVGNDHVAAEDLETVGGLPSQPKERRHDEPGEATDEAEVPPAPIPETDSTQGDDADPHGPLTIDSPGNPNIALLVPPTTNSPEVNNAALTVREPTLDALPQRAPGAPKASGRTRLEINGDQGANATAPKLRIAEPSMETSTELVHVPNDDPLSVALIDRFFAFMLFVSGVCMISGTFMVWVTSSVEELGWDRPDGIVVVVAGVVAAAVAGPLFVGLWVSWARGAAAVAGLTVLAVSAVVAVTTLSDQKASGEGIGTGLYLVGSAAIVAVIVGAAVRSPDRY